MELPCSGDVRHMPTLADDPLPMPPDPRRPLLTPAIRCQHPPVSFEAGLVDEAKTGRGFIDPGLIVGQIYQV